MIFQPQFLTSATPLAEYPRPQFKRDSYFSLNGEWQYAIRKEKNVDGYDGNILVPYAPECQLSGVRRQLQKDEYLLYKKVFVLPDNFVHGRVVLHFGACDQVCEAALNGKAIGGHEGGYLPFSFDVTEALKDGENELTLIVQDDADSDVYGRGKQRYKRGGIWYTATSGIWQSVWLESVPNAYLQGARFDVDFDKKTLTVQTERSGDGEVEICVFDGDVLLAQASTIEGKATLDVSACNPWTPDLPELYTVKLTYGEDTVESYFGLRKFSVVERNGLRYFALNDKPIFHNGLLDQGYWHDGLYTPPTNKAMYDEIKNVKDLGFNMLRKHIKVEPLLWYYYCDVLGMLVWQDMINGGSAYPAWRIMLAPFLNLHLDDSNYKKMGRSKASRKQYYAEAYGMMELLHNCVSLCLWTPFNEAWGQFDALKVWQELKLRDPSRLFDHASGWQDMGGGDVCSRHIYFRKARPKNDGKRVLALTEFGGYSHSVQGHVFSDKKFGYKTFKSAEGLEKAIDKLFRKEIFPLIEKQGLCATVYTELTDVEDEVNGLFTFDRVLKLSPETVKKMNADLYACFEESVKPVL